MMSVAVITYDHAMGRWEPDARGRLEQAAMELYAERGFEQTTVAEIAERAGLTERTFFRHFADKREVLFSGTEMLRELVARRRRRARHGDADGAVAAALEAAAAMLRRPGTGPAARRHRVRNTELQERELIKLATLAAAMAGALRDRGVPDPAASLAAEAGVAVFKIAFARWVSEPGQPDLPGIIRESMGELRGMLTGRLTEAGSLRLL